MVHKVAQEASRRTTPARALTHAVAPPLDRTFDSPVTSVDWGHERISREESGIPPTGVGG